MLSEKIDTMAERLEPYRHAGLQAAPEAVTVLAAMLRAMADEARHLEAATVPDEMRRQTPRIDAADLSAGRVVRLAGRGAGRKRQRGKAGRGHPAKGGGFSTRPRVADGGYG